MRILLATTAFLVLSAPAMAADCAERQLDGTAFYNAPICVPSDPQRIVVLDPTFSLGMALELDAPVVGAPLFGMSDERLAETAVSRSVTDLGAFTEPSVEKIVALQPDLIIGSAAVASTAHQMLAELAPTVLVTEENWLDYYAAVAEALGRTAQLEPLRAAYEARVAALASQVPSEAVSVVRITSWDFQVYTDGPKAYGPFAVLEDVGVTRAAYERSVNGESLKRPDWEDLAQLDGGTLLYIIGGANNSDTNGRLEEVTGNPLWSALPAVKAGRAYAVDPAVWMEFSGFGSADRVLDDVERYIVGSDASGN